MLISQAILLGIIQGVTEFVPISSTAHLTLAGRLMRIANPDTPDGSKDWTAFIAVIQMGTLMAALIYFLPDIIHIAAGLVGTNPAALIKHDATADQEEWARLGWLLAIASIPIGVAGFAFRRRIEGTLTKDPRVIVGALLAVAVLMAIGEAYGSQTREISAVRLADAIVVGISQVLGLVPGASRSAATISAGLVLGLARQAAARFSFLLMMPAVAASGLFKLPSALQSMNVGRVQIAAGMLAAGITGYLAIGLMLGYLQSHTLYPFVVYRLAAGMLISALLLSGRLKSS
jgi:undecaprenyl-diphosphatase